MTEKINQIVEKAIATGISEEEVIESLKRMTSSYERDKLINFEGAIRSVFQQIAREQLNELLFKYDSIYKEEAAKIVEGIINNAIKERVTQLVKSQIDKDSINTVIADQVEYYIHNTLRVVDGYRLDDLERDSEELKNQN